MRSINCKRWVVLGVLVSFLWSVGCATTESYKAPVRTKTEAYIIELEDEVVDGQYDTMPLGAGDTAPGDGIWIDKESAKDLLEALARYKGLRSKVEVQNQTTILRAKQIDVLYEAIDLQKEANVELIREIERNKKWSKVEKWGSVILTILGIVGSKYVWD